VDGVGTSWFCTSSHCGYVSNSAAERGVQMPPHHVETDVEIRHWVPQGSRSYFRHAEIGIAVGGSVSYQPVYGVANEGLRRTIVLHAPHAAIDRRSPLRIPPMLIGGVEGPYGGEFHIGAGAANGAVHGLGHPPKCQVPAAEDRSSSPGWGCVACG